MADAALVVPCVYAVDVPVVLMTAQLLTELSAAAGFSKRSCLEASTVVSWVISVDVRTSVVLQHMGCYSTGYRMALLHHSSDRWNVSSSTAP